MNEHTRTRDQGDLGAQIGQLSRQMDALKTELSRTVARLQSGGGDQLTSDVVRQMIETRRLKAQFFPEISFADPAWDMILHLTVARLDGEKVSVTDLCIASNVPYTTALRWITNLEKSKLFERSYDAYDRRRMFIQLSDAGFDSMQRWYVACTPITAIPSRPPAGT